MSDINYQTIDFRRMSMKAHSVMIEEIMQDQLELVRIEQLRRMFKDRALPPQKMLNGFRDALSNAPERMARHEKFVRERLEKNYKAVEFLETVFHDEQNADMEAFAQMVRERALEIRRENAKSGANR